jgi:putative transposase
MTMNLTERLIRSSLRLKGYDYPSPGAYFVTICTDQKICYFGNIVDGIMISFPIIDVVREIWLDIPKKFPCVDLDAFIIMPNHIHGILIVRKELMNQISSEEKSRISMEDSNQTLGKIIRYFKAKSAGIIHRSGFPKFDWQRNYFEHVVRSLKELNAIREYIINNPIRWTLDRENRLSENFNMDLDRYFLDIFER